MQITVLKQSCDLIKAINFFKRHFHGYHPDIFSKFFWMVHRFYGLWYTLPPFFVEYWTEVRANLVSNRSRGIMQFLSRYFAKTVSNLGLVFSRIYDFRNWISENYEYFESFQSNIQPQKGYHQNVHLQQ